MGDEKHIIHIRIRDLRRERAMTQEELAEALGLSRQSINAMEAGRCLPSLPVALQIASYFSVPLTTVFAMDGAELQEAQDIMNKQMVPWVPMRDLREVFAQESAAMHTPAANLSQTTEEIQVDLRLPGFTKENLTIEVGENFLVISGQIGENKPEKDVLHQEFTTEAFTRTMSLPTHVEPNSAKAEMKHGVLHITLKKALEDKLKTRRVEITSE